MGDLSKIRAENFARLIPADSRPGLVEWSARMNGLRDSRAEVARGWGVEYDDESSDRPRCLAVWRDDMADPERGKYARLARAYYAVSDGATVRLMLVAGYGPTEESHVMFLEPFDAWTGVPPEGPALVILVTVDRPA